MNYSNCQTIIQLWKWCPSCLWIHCIYINTTVCDITNFQSYILIFSKQVRVLCSMWNCLLWNIDRMIFFQNNNLETLFTKKVIRSNFEIYDHWGLEDDDWFSNIMSFVGQLKTMFIGSWLYCSYHRSQTSRKYIRSWYFWWIVWFAETRRHLNAGGVAILRGFPRSLVPSLRSTRYMTKLTFDMSCN